jgi:soluble lytic murein transglycosylase-like protein
MSSTTRKLLVGLSTAGAVAIALGAPVQADAAQRTLSVTLLGGKVVQVTVEAPAELPVAQIPLPDLGAPVLRVAESTPAPAATTTTPATTTDAAPSAGTTTQAAPTPADDDAPVGDDSGGEGREAATAAAKRRAAEDRKAAAAREAAADRRAAQRREATARRRDRTDGRKVTRDEVATTPAEAAGTSGATTQAAPATTTPVAPLDLGVSSVAVPDTLIEGFRIPPFLLPIYQAAGIEYGIRWEVLAAINEVETDYGRNLNVSSAGALGWMQFMPATWKSYGVDANGDGTADPFNPVDAIFAAARYLKAAGGQDDIRRAIFAYNHADWYVDAVLLRARVVAGLPDGLVGSLTGLTQGLFPVAGKARYDDAPAGTRAIGATEDDDEPAQQSAEIVAKDGAPAVAVQDATVVALGTSKRLGRFVRLRDVYGNVYTYGGLREVAPVHPVARDDESGTVATPTAAATSDPAPTTAASAGEVPPRAASTAAKVTPAPAPAAKRTGPVPPADDHAPVFANPARPAARAHGGDAQLAPTADPAGEDDGAYSSYLSTLPGLSRDDVRFVPLRKGSRVMAGTILGRVGPAAADDVPADSDGAAGGADARMTFEIRPAGKGAPRVDPRPILDGWKLLRTTTVLRAKDSSPLFSTTGGATAGQVLLMSKAQLQERVLADPNLDVYAAGREQIRAGAIDRRVLATLEYLTANGLRIGVSSLGRPGAITTSGNVSEHDSGNAVDISSVNGIAISGRTQGAGSITERTIRTLLGLQGTMEPHQIISLMTFEGAANTMSLPDHDDHIHVGFRPTAGTGSALGAQVSRALQPGQWVKLIDRIASIDNPTVLSTPSKYALRTPSAAARSVAGAGDD